MLQTFLEAVDLSRMAACVDLEYKPEGPTTFPLMCKTATQEKVVVTTALAAHAVKGPVLDRLGSVLGVDEGSPNLRFDVFHFHNAHCDEWLTVLCSAIPHESGVALIRLARGRLLFDVEA